MRAFLQYVRRPQTLLVGLAVIAVELSFWSWAQPRGRYGVLTPARGSGAPSIVPLTGAEAMALVAPLGGPKTPQPLSGPPDTIYTTCPIPGNVNLGVECGDTLAAYFRPPVPISIVSVGFNAHSWREGTPLPEGISVAVRLAQGYHGQVPPDSVDQSGWLGNWTEGGNWVHSSLTELPPLGETMWKTDSCTVDEDDIEEVPTGGIYLGERAFFLAVAPYGGGEGTYLGFDADDAGERYIARALKYHHGTGPSGRPGWHVRSYAWWAYCIVYFYDKPPVFIHVSKLLSTYDASQEFQVTATAVGLDSSSAGDLSAYLVWETGARIDSTAMERTSGLRWRGQITGVGVGDTVTYWVTVHRGGDLARYYRSAPHTFVIGQRRPGADVLLVLERPHNGSYYTDFLDEHGYVYDVWDVTTAGQMDASVTCAGYGTILVAGWGGHTLPTRSYRDHPYAQFLRMGGNLFLSDMDYFYANDEPTNAPLEFTTGDFAHDFFGLAGGVNDPLDEAGKNPQDILFVGSRDDPVSGNWAERPLRLSWYAIKGVPGWNWTDYLVPSRATAIFRTESGNCVAVRHADGFRTVFLAFMADALADTTTGLVERGADFDTLLSNVLRWFGTRQQTGISNEGAQRPAPYELGQSHPNPFNESTTIEYSLARAGRVKLAIYDLLGREVAVLTEGHKPAGRHKVIFEASGLPSGVYLYRLTSGRYRCTRKMTLVR